NQCTIALRTLSCANYAVWGSQTIAMRESRMMRKYQVRFGERSRETGSLREEKVRSAPTRLSPMLSNILLDKLDQYVETVLIPRYTRGEKRRENPVYKQRLHQAEYCFKRGLTKEGQ